MKHHENLWAGWLEGSPPARGRGLKLAKCVLWFYRECRPPRGGVD